MVNRTMCLFYYDKPKYHKLAENAIASFKQWHPDVDVFIITDRDIHLYKSKRFYKISPGITKYALGVELGAVLNYEKVIILGADTITLARLDDFLNNDEDILVGLDYGYPLKQDNLEIPASMHCNSDIACFNNIQALNEIVKKSPKYTRSVSRSLNCYNEQAGLNEVIMSNKFSYKIVDADSSSPYYNVSSKKSTTHEPERLASFTVVGDKVMTPEGRQIKIWHYCEGFFSRSEEFINNRVSECNRMFSDDVQSFLKEKSGILNFI